MSETFADLSAANSILRHRIGLMLDLIDAGSIDSEVWTGDGMDLGRPHEAWARETREALEALSTPKGEEGVAPCGRSVSSPSAASRDEMQREAQRIHDELCLPDFCVEEELDRGWLRNAMARLSGIAPPSPWCSIDDMQEEIKRDGVPIVARRHDGCGYQHRLVYWDAGDPHYPWTEVSGGDAYASYHFQDYMPLPPVQEET